MRVASNARLDAIQKFSSLMIPHALALQFEDEGHFGSFLEIKLGSTRTVYVLSVDVQRYCHRIGFVPHAMDDAIRHRQNVPDTARFLKIGRAHV